MFHVYLLFLLQYIRSRNCAELFAVQDPTAKKHGKEIGFGGGEEEERERQLCILLGVSFWGLKEQAYSIALPRDCFAF